jgi:hypothetical protein
MINESVTASEIEEQRLQHVQRVWAARNNNDVDLTKKTSQEEYEASIRTRVSAEDFAEMVRRREHEYSNQPKLCTRTATTLTLDDMIYLGSLDHQNALRLYTEMEAKEIQQKQDEEKLARMILERGEPPVLYRKAKGKLSDFMMDSAEDIPTPHQLENIANEIFNIDLSEIYETDLSMILRLASKRYNLNKESAIDMVVEVLSKMAEVGVHKVHENNTGKVIDFRFFRKHVYDG